MHVTSYNAVLALHIIVVVASFMMAAIIHASLFQMRWAPDVSALKAIPRVLGRMERLLPVSALVVLASGAWLVHLSGGAFGWSEGWIITSVVALMAVETIGASVSRRSGRMQAAIRAAKPGPVPPVLRSLVTDPLLWLIAHLGTATFLGVVFLMATKPSGLWSVAVVFSAATAGVASAFPAFRKRSPRSHTEQQPAKAA